MPEKPTVATTKPNTNPIINFMMFSLSVYVERTLWKRNIPTEIFGSLQPSHRHCCRLALQSELGTCSMCDFFETQQTICDVDDLHYQNK
jgi:hypothetical protein